MSSFFDSLSLPETLKNYQIKEFVCSGSYGSVYRADDVRNNQSVVVKIGNKKDMKRGYQALENEVGLLLYLQHRNIVRLIDFSIQSGAKNRAFQHSALVLEHCACDFSRIMFRQPLDAREIKTVAIQILQSLEYLEDHGIIHCDVKPENILLSSDGMLKLCDFGLARRSGFCSTTVGLSQYHSPPESLLKIQTIDCSIDAWSAGCIIAELYKGTYLFKRLKKFNRDRRVAAIFRLCGSYTEEAWDALFPGEDRYEDVCGSYLPGTLDSQVETFTSDRLAQDLICGLLVTDRRYRLTSKQALTMPYIHSPPYPLPDLNSLLEVDEISDDEYFDDAFYE